VRAAVRMRAVAVRLLVQQGPVDRRRPHPAPRTIPGLSVPAVPETVRAPARRNALGVCAAGTGNRQGRRERRGTLRILCELGELCG
jgi:hypothetical protein